MRNLFLTAITFAVFFGSFASFTLPRSIAEVAEANTDIVTLMALPPIAYTDSLSEFASPPNDPSITSAIAETQEEIDTQRSVTAPIKKTEKKIAVASDAPVIKSGSSLPARLVIPSISLDVPIQGVGVNSKGEMAVPSGESDTVGWYNKGTVPGRVGSAVLDAHVFAAFQDLRYLAVGSDVYVQTEGGKTLHFKVEDSRVYALGALSPEFLFKRADARRLNLITCAGKLTPDRSTYDHRLVVYTKFVGEA